MAGLVLNDRLFQCAEDNAFDLIRTRKTAVLMSMQLLSWQTFFAMTHVLALLVALVLLSRSHSQKINRGGTNQRNPIHSMLSPRF
jgi:hypothetical protein